MNKLLPVLLFILPISCLAELNIVTARTVGMPTEVVNACIEHTGLGIKIRKVPWARAYKMATKDKNVMIYSLTFTKEREPLFTWVGPILEARQDLYRLNTRNDIVINKLNDAKSYSIGAINGFANTKYLLSRGFVAGEHIDLVTSEVQNIKKLLGGRIDIMIMGNIAIADNLKKANVYNQKDRFVPVFTVQEDIQYMGFSRGTDKKYIELFQKAYDTIINNGQYDKIKRKYLQ